MFLEIDQFLQEFEHFCERRLKQSPSYPFHGPHISRLQLCFEAQFPQTALLLLK